MEDPVSKPTHMLTTKAFAAAQLVLAEREARDRCWWDVMAKCFAPESHIEISWFEGSGAEFVARSKQMSADGVSSRHRLGPPVVHGTGDRVVITLPAAVETYPRVGGIECVLTAHCRLLYRVGYTDDAWAIAGMQAVYERDLLEPATPGQHVAVDPAQLSSLRFPYRLLAWTLAQSGYETRQDLPGDDRPDQVQELYDKAFAWADLRPPH
jgi:hypothetical protein